MDIILCVYNDFLMVLLLFYRKRKNGLDSLNVFIFKIELGFKFRLFEFKFSVFFLD